MSKQGPYPRGECPVCGRDVAVTSRFFWHHHHNGTTCPGALAHPPPACSLPLNHTERAAMNEIESDDDDGICGAAHPTAKRPNRVSNVFAPVPVECLSDRGHAGPHRHDGLGTRWEWTTHMAPESAALIIAVTIANQGDMPEQEEAEHRAKKIIDTLHEAGLAVCEQVPGYEHNEWRPV